MPNDENKIILEFPATNVEIELGETITFDNISGFLDSGRVTYNGESLTDEITHLENDKADASYVDTELANKMNKANPVGTGSFSFNRREGSTVGDKSVALGDRTIASGANSFTSGYGSVASGAKSTAMGSGNRASGSSSMAINSSNIASGDYSLAQGGMCEATEYCSHAEGYSSKASGYVSHAEGQGTIANHISQHASGEFNIPDDSSAPEYSRGKYVEIVGNGTSDNARSNARTLDWSGNEVLAGDLTFNGNKSLTSEISRLDGRIDNLPEAMVFKGTLGVNGDIQTLPTASAEIEGWTFKCITAGTYAGLELKVGDTVTCFNPPNTSVYEWDISGYGDTDTDTWRAIKVNGTEELGSGISSGSVDFVGSDNIEVEFDANGNKVGVKTKNIYTKTEVDSIVSDAIYNVLPDDTASGSVANFNTSLELPIKSLEVDVNAVQSAGTPTPASPLPISGWNKITLVNCGNKYKPNIKPFSEWERARSDYYISRFSVPNTLITVNLIDKDTTVDLTGVAFGFVDSYWNKANSITTNEYRWFIQNGTPQTTKKNIAIADASKILSGLIFSPQNEATYNKLMARYDYEFVFSETSNTEPYNTEVIQLGGTYYGGHFKQDKDGHRQLLVTHNIARYDLSQITPTTQNGWDSWLISRAERAINQPNSSVGKLCNCCPEYSYAESQINRPHYYVTGGAFVMYLPENTYRNGSLEYTYPLATPYTINLPDGEPIITLNGTNNIYADTGDTEVVFKSSVADYVNAHSGGNLLGMGGVYLGGAKSGGGEEEPDEGEDTEKAKLDDPKEEIKTIGDTKKIGGE